MLSQGRSLRNPHCNSQQAQHGKAEQRACTALGLCTLITWEICEKGPFLPYKSCDAFLVLYTHCRCPLVSACSGHFARRPQFPQSLQFHWPAVHAYSVAAAPFRMSRVVQSYRAGAHRSTRHVKRQHACDTKAIQRPIGSSNTRRARLALIP